MVLAFFVGKRRHPWRGFWLTVATFTVYRYYWDIKAHDEVFKQFELARERRDQGLVWYMVSLALTLIPFIPSVFRFIYYGIFTGNVQYLKQRFGMRMRMRPGVFLGLTITGTSVLVVTSLLGMFLIAASLEEPEDDPLTPDDERDTGGIDDGPLFAAGLSVAGTGLVTNVVLYVIAYTRLQMDLNDLWAGYQWRAAQLRGPGPSPAPPSAARPAATPTHAAGAPSPARP